MRLLGRNVLTRAARKHKDARAWLEAWAEIVMGADWEDLLEVRQVFPSADGVKLMSGTVVTVFNVRGNHYRLLTKIDYPKQTTEALDMMTHAEYSRNLWKTRY